MAVGECTLSCCFRALRRLHFDIFNIFFVVLIYRCIDRTLASGMQDALHLRMGRARYLPATSAYLLKALFELHTMKYLRVCVLAALRARCERDRTCTVSPTVRSRPCGGVCRIAGLRGSGIKASIQCL